MPRTKFSERVSPQKQAPEVAMIDGVPHMLAYINKAEKDMLRREGASGLPGPAGIPSYGWWADTFGGGNSFSQSLANAVTPNDGTSYVGGQLVNDSNPNQNVGPARDADMFAGSNYTNNGGSYSSPTSVTADDLATGNYATVPNNSGGSTVVSVNTPDFSKIPQVDIDVGGGSPGTGNGNSNIGNNDGGSAPQQPVISPVDAARAERDAALAAAQGRLKDAFSFATDDYYTGLSNAFTANSDGTFQTAYDDALRGIYEGFKAAGLVTQSGIDSGIASLDGAKSGERGKLGTLSQEYAKANRDYVNQGLTAIGDALTAIAAQSDDLGTLQSQTEQLNAYDVAGEAKPYQSPTEKGVAEFFSNFQKRAYDPSYNVSPTAVASAGPSRVTQSVQQYGANRQPSSMVGIRSPYEGQAMRVVT